MRTLAVLAAVGLGVLGSSSDGFARGGLSSRMDALQDPGVTKEDLKKLIEAKLPDSTIIAYLKSHPPVPQLSSDDIVALKKAGASDVVLEALLGASGSTTPAPATPPASTTVAPSTVVVPDYSYSYDSPYYYSYPYDSYYPYGYPYFYDGIGFGFGVPFFGRSRRFDFDRSRRFDHFDHGFGHVQGGTFSSHGGVRGTFHGGGSFGGGGGHGGGGHR